MACDMVHSFSIVLATGEVITASAEENMDLFKALKGGGGNFGVVTGFTLYTIPQLNGLWGGG
jgi:FAD/FMN-containing dehydrogenase